ncbi:MAG: AI-2E family transporter [Actinomycetota bacterium]|nr:AI-2E family transporter [Actinomycetota bacterium]
MSQWSDGFGRLAVRSAQGLLVVAFAALLIAVLVRLRLVVVPVLISTLLAAAISPMVRVLHRLGLPSALAVWAALLSGLLAIVAVVGIVVARVRSQWDDLRARAEEGLSELQRFLGSGPLPIDEGQLDQARTALVEALQGEQFRSGAIAGAFAAVEAVAGVFLGAVILFFLLKDGERIWEFLLRPLSGNRARRMRLVGERCVDVLGSYVRGTAVIALVDSVIIGIALVVLGVPLALPLALVVFVGAFIPLVGASVAGALAALVALVANGPVTALIVLGVVIAVNQIEGDVLAPVVLGRALSLHPLAILLALTVGTILAGIIGALLSVPLAAVAWTAVTAWNEDRAASTAALRPAGPAG